MKLKRFVSIMLAVLLLTALLPMPAAAAVKLPKGYQALAENGDDEALADFRMCPCRSHGPSG